MLTVNVQNAPFAVTLVCEGRIVLGLEAETLRCLATSRPERRVIVDLEGVHGMDAAGLGLLVELHCWARQRSGWLTVANPSRQVCHLIALTNLDSVLDVEGSEEEGCSAGQKAMTA